MSKKRTMIMFLDSLSTLGGGPKRWIPLLTAVLLACTAAACGGESAPPAQEETTAVAGERAAQPDTEAESGQAAASPEPTAGPLDGRSLQPLSFVGSVLGELPPLPEDDPDTWYETERDWAIASGTVEWAREQALGSLPVGELAAILGATFVGTPYEPGTLELPGPEQLIVNLRTFDCVTLVEHALVLARLTTDPAVEPAEAEAFRDRYREELVRLRYREARIDGYASRLHYFTEWLDHGIAAGHLEEVTDELGGIVDDRRIDFMSNHPEAYRQLQEDPALVETIRDIEDRLSEGSRLYVPQERIHEVEAGIRNGDIIAAVSTVDGLDIAHTGFAFRLGDRVHLLHAPLVGDSVEVSSLPLADRIQGIRGQKGIRVVRPR